MKNPILSNFGTVLIQYIAYCIPYSFRIWAIEPLTLNYAFMLIKRNLNQLWFQKLVNIEKNLLWRFLSTHTRKIMFTHSHSKRGLFSDRNRKICFCFLMPESVSKRSNWSPFDQKWHSTNVGHPKNKIKKIQNSKKL